MRRGTVLIGVTTILGLAYDFGLRSPMIFVAFGLIGMLWATCDGRPRCVDSVGSYSEQKYREVGTSLRGFDPRASASA